MRRISAIIRSVICESNNIYFPFTAIPYKLNAIVFFKRVRTVSRKTGLWLALIATAWLAQGQSGLAACKPPPFSSAERKAIPTRNIDQDLLSKAITKQTNYFRCKRGLKPVVYDPALKSAADIHARNMARLEQLSHELPVFGAGTLKQRFSKAKVKVKRMRAENIGTEFRMVIASRMFITDDAKSCRLRYYDSRKPVPQHSYGSLARSMVQRWHESKGHRAIMLSRDARRMGAAARFTSGGEAPCGTYYLAQDFAG